MPVFLSIYNLALALYPVRKTVKTVASIRKFAVHLPPLINQGVNEKVSPEFLLTPRFNEVVAAP